jgi:hypothetical protein
MTNLHRHTCALGGGRASRTAASSLLLCSKCLWSRSETRRAVPPLLLIKSNPWFVRAETRPSSRAFQKCVPGYVAPRSRACVRPLQCAPRADTRRKTARFHLMYRHGHVLRRLSHGQARSFPPRWSVLSLPSWTQATMVSCLSRTAPALRPTPARAHPRAHITCPRDRVPQSH